MAIENLEKPVVNDSQDIVNEKINVLIVDDEPEIRLILSDYLWETSQNVNILEAENGIEALEILQTVEPDLILCDIKVPQMNGMEFLKIAKSLKKESLFMMITGYGEREFVKEALNLGAFAFIDKPFVGTELEDALNHAIHFLEYRSKVEVQIETLLKEHSVPEDVIIKVFNYYHSIIKEEFTHLSKPSPKPTMEELLLLEEEGQVQE